MRIYTNTAALRSHANLKKSDNAVADAITRLSSGYRINSAKDDAAGQAIANRMTKSLRGNSSAQKNVQDAISLVNIAMSSMNEINSNLQRARELQVQYLNGTNSMADMDSISNEIDQRLTEVSRIVQTANFNGITIFNENKDLNIQVGEDANDTFNLELSVFSRPALRLATTRFTNQVHDLNIGGVTAPVIFKGFTNADGSLMSIDASTAAFGLETEDIGVITMRYEGVEQPILKVGDRYMKIDSWGTDPATGSHYPIVAREPRSFNYSDPVNGVSNQPRTASTWPYIGMDRDGFVFDYYEYSGRYYRSDDSNPTRSGPDASAVTIRKPNTVFMTRLDGAAIAGVNRAQTQLGAIANRLDSMASTLQSENISLTAARSRIEDADYAVEISNLTRGQILQQAGQSVLAQANQIPQGILSLLRS